MITVLRFVLKSHFNNLPEELIRCYNYQFQVFNILRAFEHLNSKEKFHPRLCINICFLFEWVQVWGYRSRNCLCTSKGHERNVTALFVHPKIPVVITGSDDKNVPSMKHNNHR